MGAPEARMHFSRLLEQTARGEEILITRYGRPVARLAPLRDVSRDRRRRAIQRLMEFGAGQMLGDLTVRELREKGRRA
ncbi:MAG: type II toxin-antitoxin system Phd/YefM family antitoxin [Geminicoccaceae bacterium]